MSQKEPVGFACSEAPTPRRITTRMLTRRELTMKITRLGGGSDTVDFVPDGLFRLPGSDEIWVCTGYILSPHPVVGQVRHLVVCRFWRIQPSGQSRHRYRGTVYFTPDAELLLEQIRPRP